MSTIVCCVLAASLLAVEPAFANCSVIVKQADFENHGGKLISKTAIDMSSMPYNFTCDFVPCFGVVEFDGVVDETGAIRNLSVVRNSWENRPDYHASIMAQRLEGATYFPPRVYKKPVCVNMKWRVGFSASGKVVLP